MKVALVAIIKDEAPYLEEWILHHMTIGIDHFLLYDQSDNTHSKRVLKQFPSEVITIRKWHSFQKNPQLGAYKHSLKKTIGSFDWVAFIDADEYIVPNNTDNVKQLLETYSDHNAIFINWRLFGSNGHIFFDATNSSLKARFTKRAKADSYQNLLGKTIVRPEAIIDFANAHFFLVDGTYSFLNRQPVYKDANDLQDIFSLQKISDASTCMNIAQINHYFCKSKEEWLQKCSKKRVSNSKIRRTSDFLMRDMNEIEDTSLLQFEKKYQIIKASFDQLHNCETLIQDGVYSQKSLKLGQVWSEYKGIFRFFRFKNNLPANVISTVKMHINRDNNVHISLIDCGLSSLWFVVFGQNVSIFESRKFMRRLIKSITGSKMFFGGTLSIEPIDSLHNYAGRDFDIVIAKRKKTRQLISSLQRVSKANALFWNPEEGECIPLIKT